VYPVALWNKSSTSQHEGVSYRKLYSGLASHLYLMQTILLSNLSMKKGL